MAVAKKKRIDSWDRDFENLLILTTGALAANSVRARRQSSLCQISIVRLPQSGLLCCFFPRPFSGMQFDQRTLRERIRGRRPPINLSLNLILSSAFGPGSLLQT
jgi:hypothetical protein